MRGISTVSTTVAPSIMETKMLTEADLTAINTKFNLDLDYENATHYRAAQVIWSISRLKDLSLEALPDRDTPKADPDREGTASSCPSSNADTDD